MMNIYIKDLHQVTTPKDPLGYNSIPSLVIRQENGNVLGAEGPGPPLFTASDIYSATEAPQAGTGAVVEATIVQAQSTFLSQATEAGVTSQGSIVSVLFAPTEHQTTQQLATSTVHGGQNTSVAAARPAVTSSVSAITVSNATSSRSTESRSSSPTVAPASVTEHTFTKQGSTVAGSIQTSTGPSKPITTNENVASGIHSSPFYIGIAFAAVAAVAVVFAFVGWILRLQNQRESILRRRSSDVENRNLVSGLGFPFNSDKEVRQRRVPPINFEVVEKREANPFEDPPSFSALQSGSQNLHPDSTLPVRPLPIRLRSSDSMDQPRQLLGPLHVKNLAPGDISTSSSMESVQREGGAGERESGSHSGYCRGPRLQEFGTPREEVPGAAPRFMGLDGQGLGVPWEQSNTSSMNVTQGTTDQSAPVENYAEDEWASVTIPSPYFATPAKYGHHQEGTERWGQSLRNGFFSAISAVTRSKSHIDNLSYKDDEKYTLFPSRSSFRLSFNRNSMCARSTSRVPIEEEDGPQPTLPQIDTDIEAGETLGEEIERIMTMDTRPLEIRKKLEATSHPAHPPEPVTGGVGLEQPQLDTLQLARDRVNLSNSTFDSEASKRSQNLSDEEMRAKRMLALRARRKNRMSRRELATCRSRSGSDRSVSVKSVRSLSRG